MPEPGCIHSGEFHDGLHFFKTFTGFNLDDHGIFLIGPFQSFLRISGGIMIMGEFNPSPRVPWGR